MRASNTGLPHRTRRLPAVIGLVMLLGACASFKGAPEWPMATDMAASDPLHDAYLKKYYLATTLEARQSIRNEFIEVRTGLIDRAYAGFKQTVYTQRVSSAVAVDLATLTLNAIGAAVSDVGTKTATSALSGGLIGGQASIDKNVYFDRTLPAMLAQMDGMRAQVRVRLLDGMLVGVDRYPLMQAAADLDAYFQAGTISGAISAITTQAAVEQRAAEVKLKSRLPSEEEISGRLKKMGFDVQRAVDTQSTRTLQGCLDPSGKLDPATTEALGTWLKQQPGFDASSPFAVTDFLSSPKFEELRAKALADNALMSSLKGCK